MVWDAIIPSDYAPWHENTYIHPTVKDKTKKKSASKRSAKGKPYPAGAEPGILKLDKQNPKYRISDISGKLAERSNASLTLHWNVQPWVGAMVWDNRQTLGRWQRLKGGESRFDFPAIKSAETVKSRDMPTEAGAERNKGSPA